jgi:hypothetical protein
MPECHPTPSLRPYRRGGAGRRGIANENRAAAPRLRLVGAFPPREHTTAAFTQGLHREDYGQGSDSEIPGGPRVLTLTRACSIRCRTRMIRSIAALRHWNLTRDSEARRCSKRSTHRELLGGPSEQAAAHAIMTAMTSDTTRTASRPTSPSPPPLSEGDSVAPSTPAT